MISRQKLVAGTRKSGIFRCLLAIVALFYGAQQLSVVAHLTLVRHAVCDEHGELIDVEASAAAAGDASASTEQSKSAHASRSSHQHEHCGVLAHLREQLTPHVFSGAPVRVAAVASVAVETCPTPPPRTTVVYVLAPKNSPPV